jgi:hypothetical protein
VRRITVVAALCALPSLAWAAGAQLANRPSGPNPDQRASVPDLAGTWVLDKQKSDFGLLPTPTSDTSIYTRVGTVYQIVEVNATDTGASHITYSWPVGSGDATTDLPDLEASMQTRVTLHGDTAMFVSQLKHAGRAIEIQSGREFLSSDGKVRTREYDLQSLVNPDEDLQHVVAVFRRQ